MSAASSGDIKAVFRRLEATLRMAKTRMLMVEAERPHSSVSTQ
jgi:hypothetical protein